MNSLVILLVSVEPSLLVSAIVINAVAAIVVGALSSRSLAAAASCAERRGRRPTDVQFATSISEVTTIAQEIKIFDAEERGE
jgi:hypothetical protein